MKHILFVCTGNTCRSPMAEWLLRKLLAEKNVTNVMVGSAGVAAFDGMEASENAISVMKEEGIDLHGHKSTQISAEILKQADIVYAMTDAHRKALLSAYSQYNDKIKVFGHGISDPYGCGVSAYRRCRDQIEQHLRELVEDILHEQ